MADNKFLTNFNNLQEQIYQRLNPNPQSPSALKDAIARAIRPSTDKQLGMIKKNLASTKAGIDVDASNRGLGGSSWNTDAKLRAEQMAAQNAADVEGEYQANLYNAVLNRLNAQDELSMSARNNAFGLAQGLYDRVYKPTGGVVSTGGRGGSRKTAQEQALERLNDFASQNVKTVTNDNSYVPGYGINDDYKLRLSKPVRKITSRTTGVQK